MALPTSHTGGTYTSGGDFLPRPSGAAMPVQDPPKAGLMGVWTFRRVFNWTGALVLAIMCSMPVSNAILLLQDWNYTYWYGASGPIWIIVGCVSILVVWVISVHLFWTRVPAEKQSDQTLILLLVTFALLLGLLLITSSIGLSGRSYKVPMQLMNECSFNANGAVLHSYATVLRNIRDNGDCKDEVSVATCKGFEQTPETDYLQYLEGSLGCVGFCTEAGGSLLNESPAGNAMMLFSQGQAVSKPIHPPTAFSFFQTEVPALFSAQNFQTPCSVAIARSLTALVGSVASVHFMYGATISGVVLLISFLKLCSMCDTPFGRMSRKAMRNAPNAQAPARAPDQSYGSAPRSSRGGQDFWQDFYDAGNQQGQPSGIPGPVGSAGPGQFVPQPR